MTFPTVFSPTPFSAYPLSPRSVDTMAHSLKCLLITLKNIDEALISPKNAFRDRNLEILTERKKELEWQIEQLKGKLGIFKADLSASDLSTQIMQKEGIFRAAESIHFLLPSTHLDTLLFQRSELIHLLKKCKENAPVEELRLILNTLPPNALEQFYYCVWLAHKTPFILDYGKNTLLENPFILMEIKDPFLFPGCENVIEQMIGLTEEEIQLEEKKGNESEFTALMEKRKENQKQLFLSLFHSPHINQKQLKKIYNRLDPEVKDTVPSPPYFGHGVHHELYKTLGAHLTSHGTIFQVMAPRAKHVSVALRADGKDASILPMQKDAGSGIWKIEALGIKAGQIYQYVIEDADGHIVRKADPFAFGFMAYQDPFRHESIVRSLDFHWDDHAWIEQRTSKHLKPQPISIYEMHISSWRKNGNRSMSYRELADEHNPNSLVSHCKRMNYTHVELMGVLEHPQEISWGYQVTGYFAPNHRLGTIEDFQYLVNKLHQHHIGVFLDWIPAHFANDSFGLVQFDGSPLYEHHDHRRSEQPTWGTKIFNYENEYVRNFLISCARFWIEKMHIDGLRVDAVTSMFHLNYDKETDWLPNHKNGSLNLAALWFM
ncbi:MAG TPA: alpha-amylase family glycosyl hydrolase, partial [Chlamydiales bacterium]|nr:alpha-amylase family glycosyl hydrolase [Chlamydiales bacterium]